MDLTTESNKAFEEAYCFSGALVTIGSTENIEAILPLDRQNTQAFDDEGSLQRVGEMTITVKTADLPTITATTTVVADGATWRILNWNDAGYLGTTLNLETP